MALTLSPSSVNFDPFNRSTKQVTVSNGAGPYSISQTNSNVSAVSQGVSPNLWSDADTFSSTTLTGLTKSSGGPNNSTDAEYTGNGSPVGSNLLIDRLLPVTMGQTYTLSTDIDPSQITNNTGNGVNMLPNADFALPGGSDVWDSVDDSGAIPDFWTDYNNSGASCVYASDPAAGAPFGTAWKLTFSANSAVAKGLRFGTNTGTIPLVLKANKTYVLSYYAKSSIASAPFSCNRDNAGITIAAVTGYPTSYADTAWHRYAFTVTVGSSDYTANIYPCTLLNPAGVSANVWFAAPQLELGSTPSAWSNSNQIALGINTADNLTQILQQYVALNSTTAGRYATSAWTCPTNLAPHSDDLSTWAEEGSGGALGTGGPSGAIDWEVAGTGAAPGAYYELQSPVITVTPGQKYAPSSFVDPSQIVSGQAALQLFNPARTVGYFGVNIAAGPAGRYAGTWTCPAGVTQVVILLANNNCGIASGQKLKFSQPMLEPASSASGYYISSQNPQVHAYAELLSSAIVASGQKFKISQPMLRADGVVSPYISPTGVWNITPNQGGRSIVTFTDSASVSAALNATVYPLPNPRFPDALKVGSVNKKVIAYIGLDDYNASKGVYERSILPMGTFLLSDSTGQTQMGEVSQSARGYDISREFNFDVFGALPPPLFGIQNDIRYDSNYALKNPSGDLKTYVCDGKMFMAAKTDNPFLASAFQTVFKGSTPPAGGVNVYVGTPGSPATTPVSSSTYTWNAQTGTVTFNTAQASNAVVSVDGVPQAMSPENMLWHLFYDYGGYDSSYFKFGTTNILLPAYVGGQGKTVWQIAQDIVSATAPRSVSWRLRMDEYGYINFYEDKYADQPTETLIDERDFLQLQWTQTDNQLANVVRAEVQANNNQSVVSISYDIDSVSDNGERQTDDISTQSFLSLRGLPPLQVKSLLDTYTAVELHDKSQPILELTVTVLANPARQVGDKIIAIERQNGLSGPYIIKGITDTIDSGTWLQELRLRQVKLFANQNMGLPSAVTNTPAPGTSGDISNNKNAGVSGRSGLFKSVSVGGTQVISNGGILYDANGNAIIPVISGANWNFSFTLDSSQQYDTTVHQFLFFECPNTLSSSDIMAIKLSTWVPNDGTVIPAATVGAGYTQNASHTTGSSLGSGEKAYLYSNLVYPAYANSLPPGYQSQMTSLNWLASTGLSGSVGVGLGPAYTGSYAYLPQAKYSFGYYVLLALNAAGATSILRIPILLSC